MQVLKKRALCPICDQSKGEERGRNTHSSMLKPKIMLLLPLTASFLLQGVPLHTPLALHCLLPESFNPALIAFRPAALNLKKSNWNQSTFALTESNFSY